MSKRSPVFTMIAISSLMAAPVLAQTMNSTSTPSPLAPSAGMTSPTSPPSATSSTMSSSRSSASSDRNSTAFVTADQQIRASKLIGSTVYNDQKQEIGSIDELLVDQNHDVANVVLSVGGFLGLGSKLVAVPYSELHVTGGEIVMSGATKEQLTQMPSYKFTGST